MTSYIDAVAAISTFAAANGRGWKSKLRSLWSAGKTDGALRHARNLIGPAWLKFSAEELGFLVALKYDPNRWSQAELLKINALWPRGERTPGFAQEATRLAVEALSR